MDNLCFIFSGFGISFNIVVWVRWYWRWRQQVCRNFDNPC